MKKLLIILILFVLCACKEEIKKEDFYNVSCGPLYFVPGYDVKGSEQIGDIERVEYTINKDREVLSYVEFYTDDNLVKIDDYVEGDIEKTCNDFQGELINKNGVACYISKRVNGRENYIVLHGDVLDDDIYKIDRVEVGYDVEEIIEE